LIEGVVPSLAGPAEMLAYRASKADCDACPFKTRCCPKEPSRKILRSLHEEARDVARALAKTEAFQQSCRERKRVEIAVCSPEAHRTHPASTLGG
jgi:Transposase DDE domain